MNDKLEVLKDFEFPSGISFKKGERFYGTWNYFSSTNNTKNEKVALPTLVVICNYKRGPYLTQKEFFKLL